MEGRSWHPPASCSTLALRPFPGIKPYWPCDLMPLHVYCKGVESLARRKNRLRKLPETSESTTLDFTFFHHQAFYTFTQLTIGD